MVFIFLVILLTEIKINIKILEDNLIQTFLRIINDKAPLEKVIQLTSITIVVNLTQMVLAYLKKILITLVILQEHFIEILQQNFVIKK